MFSIGNGAGAIITAEQFEQLPGYTNAFIQYQDNKYYSYEKGSAKSKTVFIPDYVTANLRDDFGRAMAPLRVVDSDKTNLIPSSLSFFEGMGILHPQDWPLQK